MDWTVHAYIWPMFWIAFWGWRSMLKHRRRMEELRLQGASPEPASPLADRAELAELRDRVKVLERITVDERHSRQLADEIESLRDR